MKNIISVITVIVGLLLATQVFAGQAVKAEQEIKGGKEESPAPTYAPMKKTLQQALIAPVEMELVVAGSWSPCRETGVCANWIVYDTFNPWLPSSGRVGEPLEIKNVWLVDQQDDGILDGVPEEVPGYTLTGMETYRDLYIRSRAYLQKYLDEYVAARSNNQLYTTAGGQNFFRVGATNEFVFFTLSYFELHLMPVEGEGLIIIRYDSPLWPGS